MSSNFHTKHLQVSDWEILKNIRLEALKLWPTYFAPSKDETQLTQKEWQNRLRSPHAASFALFKGNKAIGLTGIVKDNLNPHATNGILVSSYIHSDYKGQGLSKLLYECRIQWAKQQNLDTITIQHHKHNHACKAAHQKFGFHFVEETHYIDSKGQTQSAEIYQLGLKKVVS